MTFYWHLQFAGAFAKTLAGIPSRLPSDLVGHHQPRNGHGHANFVPRAEVVWRYSYCSLSAALGPMKQPPASGVGLGPFRHIGARRQKRVQLWRGLWTILALLFEAAQHHML